ncbi:MAG: helix-turn-helix transcriptional regulator [Pseudomonadota bacterium]
MTDYLTTREVAGLLRIKERKVYDLAARGQIPVSKSFGKLLFPRADIEAWIAGGIRDGGTAAPALSVPAQTARRTRTPDIVVGSHDPLLDWALRESGSGLATYFDGSTDGLERLGAAGGVAAGLHLYDADQDAWNTPVRLGALADAPLVLVEWARRARGLITPSGSNTELKGLADIAGLRRTARQDGAGAEVLFRVLAEREGMVLTSEPKPERVRTETDAALAVLEGRADVAFGLKAHAHQMGLRFTPLIEERFDLLVCRASWFEPPLQRLFAFCRSAAFAERASTLAGYDVSGLGTVHHNGP